MPKTIDYPRTTYQSAWEVSEVVDDTGGKCSIETCARKLNRKVSGSFKAILGSAVKFGLLTSKRELLTTTNLFRRIKHAYDKQEETLYHREAFLHPPLFTQICRKFRNRELPVHMFDIMLIREFGVEEINAQNVAKSFVDGARMAGILDERNVIVDIDQLAAQQGPRRELASGEMPLNLFRAGESATAAKNQPPVLDSSLPNEPAGISSTADLVPAPVSISASRADEPDPVSALFGLASSGSSPTPAAAINSTPAFIPSADQPASPESILLTADVPVRRPAVGAEPVSASMASPPASTPTVPTSLQTGYQIHISGPGIDSHLHIQDTDDLEIVRILLDKIRKQLS